MNAEADELRRRGNRYFDKEDFKMAEQCFSSALLLEPRSPALLCNRALSRIRLKQWDEAIFDCNECLKVDPDNAKALARRGRFEKKKNEKKRKKTE